MELAFLPRQIFSFAVYNPNCYSIVLEYGSLKNEIDSSVFIIQND